ncbi:hypothetical protein HYH03_002492 [Edaphochlamys debaryana]|uniref:Ribosomal RNA small subunit methyltransferase G n=1 Tax=Edaphochlamys debaryana TaxID=47281 RepID=A0A835YAW4_9CHLO|nr:hypothetical protein HYH03_002492 [Edaphochlamys debaryana]|eukprot:KAG2499547.1 hypothetical protein HYH03_002492 [Edaphochlamys debaryana]
MLRLGRRCVGTAAWRAGVARRLFPLPVHVCSSTSSAVDGPTDSPAPPRSAPRQLRTRRASPDAPSTPRSSSEASTSAPAQPDAPRRRASASASARVAPATPAAPSPAAPAPAPAQPDGPSTEPASTPLSVAECAPTEALRRYGLSAQQQGQLAAYLEHLLEVNKSMNLTAIRDPAEAWQRHVVDSLALLGPAERHAEAAGLAQEAAGRGQAAEARRRGGGGRGAGPAGAGAAAAAAGAAAAAAGGGGGAAVHVAVADAPLRVVDVGTGAGLPGMVLAVARPQWKVTLLDSLRKRCDFLREAAALAGMSNVEVVWARAEDAGQKPELRQSFDLAVARAVAEARVLAELCLPFVRVGGLWVAAKGPDPEAEVEAAQSAVRQLGGRQLALERVESLSAEGRPFTALVVAKHGPTPARFPRQAGTPSKKPL